MTTGEPAIEMPELAMGCMRIADLAPAELDAWLTTALELGANFFDHADIYAAGRCETAFAAAVQRLKLPREALLLQGKCGIRDGYFDFSRSHILASVDGILQRLNTDYLDTLLLHRPDALVEPEEVADAFEQLQRSGKVRAFGVSNHNAMQIELLQRHCPMKLAFNQLQLSMAFTPLIDAGLNVNMHTDAAVVRDGNVLDYCRLHRITVQAWSPFQHGFFAGAFLGNPQFAELNATVRRIAQHYGVSDTAVAVAWIARHPARIQTVLGTTNVQRLRDAAQSQGFVLSRAEWYGLYRAAGNTLP